MDTALLIVGMLLVLAAFAPTAPTPRSARGSGPVRRGIVRQRRLWQRYLDDLQRW